MTIIRNIFILFSLLLLTACAATNKNATGAQNGDNAMVVAEEDGAYSEGAGDNYASRFTSDDARCKAAAQQAGKNQRLFFGFDQFDMRPEFERSMQLQAEYLNSHPGTKIQLDGHTDDRGSREYNVALGWKRAKAVANYLEQFGVNNKQITMVSYGAEKPVALGHNEADYQCNRRVDFIYTQNRA